MLKRRNPIEKYNQMKDAEKENFFWRGRLTNRGLPDLYQHTHEGVEVSKK